MVTAFRTTDIGDRAGFVGRWHEQTFADLLRGPLWARSRHLTRSVGFSIRLNRCNGSKADNPAVDRRNSNVRSAPDSCPWGYVGLVPDIVEKLVWALKRPPGLVFCHRPNRAFGSENRRKLPSTEFFNTICHLRTKRNAVRHSHHV